MQGNLEVQGVLRARAFLQFSDIRLKTDIHEIVDAMEMITKLEGKFYQWKNDQIEGNGGERVIGLIAQEVQKVLPEVSFRSQSQITKQVVREDPETGILSVSYVEILPVLIEAYKEFLSTYRADKENVQKQLKELQDRIKDLDSSLEKGIVSFVHLKGGRERDVTVMVEHLTIKLKHFLEWQQPQLVPPEHTFVAICDDNDQTEVYAQKSILSTPSVKSEEKWISGVSYSVVVMWMLVFTGIAGVVSGAVLTLTSLPGQIQWDQVDEEDFDSSNFSSKFAIGIVFLTVGLLVALLSCVGICCRGFFVSCTKARRQKS